MDDLNRREFYGRLRNYIIIFIAIQLSWSVYFIIIESALWRKHLIFSAINILAGILLLIIFGKRKKQRTENEYKFLENTILTADKIQSYFKQGLNRETAQIIAEIVKNMCDVPAVAITDKENVLAFVGTGCEYHPAGYPIKTEATLEAIHTGNIKIVQTKEEFKCMIKNCDCPLESAIIVPLFNKNRVIGSLKFYKTKKGEIPKETINLASGVGRLINMQIELAELDRQTQLATKAKLDALQAQINPHFLYNSLNTIKMYINKDPELARKLIVKLSMQLRHQLSSNEAYITLVKEIEYIDDYIMIENARFRNKLTINYNIEENLKDITIPTFTVHPLVQNAVQHGILPKKGNGNIKVSIISIDNDVYIEVEDDGVGIDKESMEKIFEQGYGTGCGVGISNVNDRLKILYGQEHGLKIESKKNVGTKAFFRIPNNKIIVNKEGENNVN